ncbi:hypothetical protein IHQ11_28295 [Priestia megaterium]|uniref:hypothetical protein n=1 Tax=Priestia megaterium TaxID=1404 RepID=UPI001B3A0520|nr:hypothetical protein [Priestia megaterium]MBQ4870324.1 hypothetical protein [Priestia megaterium]
MNIIFHYWFPPLSLIGKAVFIFPSEFIYILIAETATGFGLDKLEIAQASLLGQPLHLLSPLVGSVYVLIGLVGIDFRDHIKFSTKYAVGTSLVMIITAIIFGVLSL